jgi:hypothetical protein
MEEYLSDVFMKHYTGIKDDGENAFDNWLSNLDNSELIEYADEYGELMLIKGQTSK